MSDGETRMMRDKPYWAPFVVALVMFLVLVSFYIDPTLLDFSKYGLDFVTDTYLPEKLKHPEHFLP